MGIFARRVSHHIFSLAIKNCSFIGDFSFYSDTQTAVSCEYPPQLNDPFTKSSSPLNLLFLVFRRGYHFFYFMEGSVNKSIERLLSLALVAAAVCGIAYGNEPGVEQPVRVEVGVKKEFSKKGHHKRHKGAKNNKHSSPLRAKCFGEKSWYIPAYQPTYYIKSIGADGDTIAMNDETVWSIDGNSSYIAARWVENTPIVITPSKWYSKYDYYITNKLTNESVTAKLSQGPFVKYSVFIQQIDWYSGAVYLTNGTRWNTSVDQNFRYWQVGQAILIGENTGWFEKDYILININENNYVTASRLP